MKEERRNPKVTTLTHGHYTNGRASPTYKSWTNMRGRCENESSPSYHNYGGRGIKVCARWKTFALFLADMGVRPAGTWLDRLDNNKDYSKDNCKWSTPKEQAQNRRPPRRRHAPKKGRPGTSSSIRPSL